MFGSRTDRHFEPILFRELELNCLKQFLAQAAQIYKLLNQNVQPYHPEHARSHQISEAKQGRAWIVLGWETTGEHQVL